MLFVIPEQGLRENYSSLPALKMHDGALLEHE